MEFNLENIQGLRQDKSEQALVDHFIEEIKNGVVKAAPYCNRYFTSFCTRKEVYQKVKKYFDELGFCVKAMRSGTENHIIYLVYLTW